MLSNCRQVGANNKFVSEACLYFFLASELVALPYLQCYQLQPDKLTCKMSVAFINCYIIESEKERPYSHTYDTRCCLVFFSLCIKGHQKFMAINLVYTTFTVCNSILTPGGINSWSVCTHRNMSTQSHQSLTEGQ